MATILLTGASGYLGKNLIPVLLERGYHVIALIINHSDFLENIPKQLLKNINVYNLKQITLDSIFKKHQIDLIIHTATIYGRKRETPAEILQTNVQFPLEILSLALSHGVKVFINTDTILVKNLNPYALTKSQFVEWLDFYSDKITTINMRLDHFYGPHDNPIKFVTYVIEQLRNNVPCLNLTEGAQTRDCVYIKDVVAAYLCVLDHLEQMPRGKINHFTVGTQIKTSIKSLVLTLQKMIGNTTTKLNFGAIPYRKKEVLDYEIDASALHRLGWKYTYNLQQGLNDLFQIEKGQNK